MSVKTKIYSVLLVSLVALIYSTLAHAERIKDVASIAGIRSNQLLGYGLVVGLNKTGGNTPFAQRSLRSMLKRFGISIPDSVDPKSKSIAAVAVHSELPAFSKPGQKIDVTVSSLGNASSLRGGTLLMTLLKGVDNEVYAVAQGNLIVGGFGVSGKDGSKITVNVPSAGRIPGGAIVERSAPTDFGVGNAITLNLHTADFTSASRLSQAINTKFGENTAKTIDAASVRVSAPVDSNQRVSFVATLNELTLVPGEAPARVIINSRTGTVVINQTVKVMPAAVAHGSLVVTIKENSKVSQPGPFASGTTQVQDDSQITIEQGSDRMFLFDPGVSLSNIVEAVNKVGIAPGDLVAILEALKEAGALRAELIVI